MRMESEHIRLLYQIGLSSKIVIITFVIGNKMFGKIFLVIRIKNEKHLDRFMIIIAISTYVFFQKLESMPYDKE